MFCTTVLWWLLELAALVLAGSLTSNLSRSYGAIRLINPRYLSLSNDDPRARCHGAPAQSDGPRPLLFVAYKLESAHLPGSKVGNYPPKTGFLKERRRWLLSRYGESSPPNHNIQKILTGLASEASNIYSSHIGTAKTNFVLVFVCDRDMAQTFNNMEILTTFYTKVVQREFSVEFVSG